MTVYKSKFQTFILKKDLIKGSFKVSDDSGMIAEFQY